MPVFVTEAGDVLADSTAILRWADTRLERGMRLYPEGALGAEAAALETPRGARAVDRAGLVTVQA